MRASRTPPDGYVQAGSVTLRGNRRLLLWMNVTSVPGLIIAGYGFAALASVIRPELFDDFISWLSTSWSSSAPASMTFIVALFGLLLMPFVVLVLHEAVHGLAFWLYTGTRPEFGYRGWYAYAAAPGWYLGRNQYLVVGLAPLVGISVTAIVLVPALPAPLAIVVLFGAALNAASATGDLYLCARIITTPAAAVIEDRHDGITWLVPVAVASRIPVRRVDRKPERTSRRKSL
ncbi:DUF3267 domain-containing protein [Actinoplanes sp. NPDC023801]|uniref:DUF3267 domain-containing protein n=1 Tax=Actinoplanes sp. NPDC023801 TaxID=3154595 RepID=UPI003410355E